MIKIALLLIIFANESSAYIRTSEDKTESITEHLKKGVTFRRLIDESNDPPCEMRPSASFQPEDYALALALVGGGECQSNDMCCITDYCCGQQCRNNEDTYKCEPLRQINEPCIVNDSCSTNRCWYTFYEPEDTDMMTAIWESYERGSRSIGLPFTDRRGLFTCSPAVEDLKSVGETCSRGAECVTDACNESTRTCQYACIGDNEGTHIATQQLDSIGINNWDGSEVEVITGIQQGSCAENQRCGAGHLSQYGSCETKYELGATCTYDSDCFSDSCRGSGGVYTCRGSLRENGQECNDGNDCVSNICSSATGLCAIACTSESECDGDYGCVYEGADRYCRPKYQDGEVCGVDGDCASNNCVPSEGRRICLSPQPTDDSFETVVSNNCGMSFSNRRGYTRDLGSGFNSADECIQEARSNGRCTGNAVLFYSSSYRCYCFTRCDVPDSVYEFSNLYSLYQYGECTGSPTVPRVCATRSPTRPPTRPPTPMPVAQAGSNQEDSSFETVEFSRRAINSYYGKALGRFSSPEECIVAARSDSECSLGVVSMAPRYATMFDCRCLNEGQCEFRSSSHFSVYQYGPGCDLN